MDPDKIYTKINEIKGMVLKLNQEIALLEEQLLQSGLENRENTTADRDEPFPKSAIKQQQPPPSESTENISNSPSASIEHEVAQTEQASSEYDNIPIALDMVKNSNIEQAMLDFMNKSIYLKSKMEEVIKKRLELSNIVANKRTTLMTSFNKDSRNPKVLLQKKLNILDELEIIYKECITTLNNPGLNTTPLLNILDKLYEQDDILFNINKHAYTPTHHGPIIQLIEKSTNDLLEFIKQAITASQASKPNS